MSKIAYIDTETGGVNPKVNPLLQTAIIVEIDNKVIGEHTFFSRPFDGEIIEDQALEKNGLTREQISKFSPPHETYKKIIKLLNFYINKYDPLDKFVFAGYFCRFDADFIREFFVKNDDLYYGSYFYPVLLDVASLIGAILARGLLSPMKSYKLVEVCKRYGVPLENAHEAMADIKATRELYLKIMGK